MIKGGLSPVGSNVHMSHEHKRYRAELIMINHNSLYCTIQSTIEEKENCRVKSASNKSDETLLRQEYLPIWIQIITGNIPFQYKLLHR